MARRERRDQPRIPIDVEVVVNPKVDATMGPPRLHLRTRNINMRGAFLDLPECELTMPWARGDWWTLRRLHIHTSGPPLAENGTLECEAEVRWVERRGPKRRAVGIGLLFLNPSDAWIDALQLFLDSLVA